MALKFVIPLFFCLLSCDRPRHKDLILGAWKVDSSYTFYNGFGYSKKGEGRDWAVLFFDQENTVKEIKFGTYRLHQFDFIGKDSLILHEPKQGETSRFKIKKLNDRNLTLLKHKPPIFPGDNQLRYEIRYYSRTETPADSLRFFNSKD